jgi:hypothetical protein
MNSGELSVLDYCSLFAIHASDPILREKHIAYRLHVTATNQLLPEFSLGRNRTPPYDSYNFADFM